MASDVSMATILPTDLIDVRAFCLVVDLGSLTAAAKALGETKGSVSRRLSRLERVLGVTLVNRSSRLVQATDNGAAYRLRAGHALELLDDATAELQQSSSRPTGRLRVTAPQDLGVGMLAPLIGQFIDRYPEVTVDAILCERNLDFDADQIDVALRVSKSLRDSSLLALKLTEVALGFAASPGYIAQHGAPRTPEELSDHRVLLFYGERAFETVTIARRDDARNATLLRLRPALVANDGAFIREVALSDGGIAFLPTVLIDRDTRAGRLVPILTDHQVDETATLYFLHRATQFVSPKVRAFRDFLVEALARCPKGA